MSNSYNTYYQTENLFGSPYPELIEFFSEYTEKGKILDLGCGQGRDAVPLARLGFEVTGIDNSSVGIQQMTNIAQSEGLPLTGIVADIFQYDEFANYDFVLFDSMFHFTKKDIKKETGFIRKIISKVKAGCIIIFCIQDSSKKVETLNQTLDVESELHRIVEKKFEYIFEDSESGHNSKTDYKMVVVRT